MQDHITNRQLEAVMDRFNKENPNADSAELARHMFNLGFEAAGRGGLDEAVFPEETDPDRYYQPVHYRGDGASVDYGDLPEELHSFEAFRSREDCENWLFNNGYNFLDFAIVEYAGDDIEGVRIIEP